MMLAWRHYFANGIVDEVPHMAETIICHEMHWTWQEYQEQPTWLPQMLWHKMQAEAERKNQK